MKHPIIITSQGEVVTSNKRTRFSKSQIMAALNASKIRAIRLLINKSDWDDIVKWDKDET